MPGSRRFSSFLFVVIVTILAIMSTPISAQSPGSLELDLRLGASIPFGPKITISDEQLYDVGFAGGFSVGYRLPAAPRISILGDLGYLGLPDASSSKMSALTMSAGGGYLQPLGSRFYLDGIVKGGAFLAFSTSGMEVNPMVGVQMAGGYTLNRSISLRLGAEYNILITKLNGNLSAFYHGLEVFASARFAFGGTSRARAALGEPDLDAVFPVQYSWYSDNPFGTMDLTNDESGFVENVVVSILVPEFMSRPAVTLHLDRLEAGETVSIPLRTRFESSILEVTEARWADMVVMVEYDYLDERLSTEETVDIRIMDRNAMSWSDDARAASFITAKNPAVQRFATTVAGIVRNSEIKAVHLNFGIAMGLFEALRLQGISYVVDPTTPYAELSSDAGAVDYLQFPHQTLQNLGGGCDDLSILYTALLQAVGVNTAFITIPGHIFMAFDSGLTYEEALKVFRNPQELIRWEGQAWIPVEITLVQEGFLKAWQTGANQWVRYSDRFEAKLIPVQEAWQDYEPVGIEASDTSGELLGRDDLPMIYQREMERFLSREMEPQIEALKSRIQSSGGTPADKNRLGALYARFGMYDKAMEQFLPVADARQPYLPSAVNAGNVYLLREQFTEAAGYFRRALAHGDSLPALVGLAQALHGTEDYSGADEAIAKVEERNADLAGRLAAAYGTGNTTRAGIESSLVLWSDD